jgi:16S rRNA (guanine527-N7)-methyltransferase
MIDDTSQRARVSAVDAADVVQRQYAESLELWRVARERTAARTLVDIGSGGGFPGLVIACVEPDLRVTLVEPLRKRARLLEEFAAGLGLLNVSVLAERAEDAGRGPLHEDAGVVTARAVAELRELLEYAAPFAEVGGLLALPKGSRVREELDASANAQTELACQFVAQVAMRPEISGNLSVVLLRKSGQLDGRYPRRAGVPGRRPL